MRTKDVFTRVRSGSMSLETVLLLPFILIGILIATYIAAHSLHRGDVVTQARIAAVNAAHNGACLPNIPGGRDLEGFDETINVACTLVDGEKGLKSVRPFWDAMRQAASAWPDIIKDVRPDKIQDVISLGYGQAQFSAPPFLKNLSEVAAQEVHRLPVAELWTQYDGAFKAGYDPVLYTELRESGTYKLFPNVFPAANASLSSTGPVVASVDPLLVQAALEKGTIGLIELGALSPQIQTLATPFVPGRGSSNPGLTPLVPGTGQGGGQGGAQGGTGGTPPSGTGGASSPTLSDEQVEILVDLLVNRPESIGDPLNLALKHAVCAKLTADMKLASLGVADLPALSPPVIMTAEQFEDYFTARTGGLKLADTIRWYKAATGKELSKETVQTLFTNPLESTKLLLENESLHTVYRTILNSKIPSTIPSENSTEWKKLPLEKSAFHGVFNTKWVSIPHGHREAVYDGDGNLVRDNIYKGTFNFFGPDRAVDHTYTDVIPYCHWGN